MYMMNVGDITLLTETKVDTYGNKLLTMLT